MIEEGDKVRLKITLYGSVQPGTVCTVTKIHALGIMDIKCEVAGWTGVHTVWKHEVDEITNEDATAEGEPAAGSPPDPPVD